MIEMKLNYQTVDHNCVDESYTIFHNSRSCWDWQNLQVENFFLQPKRSLHSWFFWDVKMNYITLSIILSGICTIQISKTSYYYYTIFSHIWFNNLRKVTLGQEVIEYCSGTLTFLPHMFREHVAVHVSPPKLKAMTQTLPAAIKLAFI